MCGIAGIVQLLPTSGIDPGCVRKMVSALRHRGPDGEGYYESEGVSLGHARLRIVDLNSGDQPIRNEDGSIWITFNGEIFNYIELRKDLERLGHRFYTETDTEVIVHLYEEYGEEFVHRLNGQFAFVLWNVREKKALLVRDRAGMLPLYFALSGNKLFFASEVKALFASGKIAPAADPNGLDQIFTFWAPLAPRTAFKGVSQVCPGEIITVHGGDVSARKYWQWDFPDQSDLSREPVEPLAEELRELLTDATRLRLRADVPVGAYLSGGLDSSAISALVREIGLSDLETFSIGFSDGALDETVHQSEMAKWLGTRHHTVRSEPGDLATDFPECLSFTEVPVLRVSPAPMRDLSKLVHDCGYKVVLTGEGADEVLGGYDIFKEAKIRSFWAAQPESTFRHMLLSKLYPYMEQSKHVPSAYVRAFYGRDLDRSKDLIFSHLPRWHMTSQIKVFFSDELRASIDSDPITELQASTPPEWQSWHPFNRAQYVEARTLLPGYLLSSQGDRMMMANSVEGRFPFLDHRIIEFARRVHPILKMRVLNEKYLLKRAMVGRLPELTLGRSKQPYRAQDAKVLLDSHSEEIRYLLDSKQISDAGYFDADRVARLVGKGRRAKRISERDSMAAIGILATQAWHRRFIQGST